MAFASSNRVVAWLLFRGGVSKDRCESFLREATHHNVTWLSAVFGVFFVWLSVHVLGNGGSFAELGLREPSALWLLRIHTMFLAFLALFLAVMVFSWPSQPSFASRLHRFLVFLGSAVFLCWAAASGAVGISVGGSPIVYAAGVIAISFLVVVHGIAMLALLLASVVVLVLVMAQLGTAPVSYSLSHPGVLFVVLVSFVGSRLFTFSRFVGWERGLRLREEVQRREEVEADLVSVTERLADYASRIGDDLALSESRFQSLIRHSADLIMTLNSEAEVLFSNRSLPGIDASPEKGCRVEDMLPSPHRHTFMAGLKSALNGRALTIEHEALDGTEWLSRMVPLSSSSGAKEVMVISSDVTARRETERRERELCERLQHAERMESLGLLAGGVAHDLNNILGPLVALPSIIREDLQSVMPREVEARQRVLSDLAVLEGSALKATDVIRDLLTLGRQHDYETDVLDLGSLVQESIGAPDLQALLDRRPGVRVETDFCGESLPVRGSACHIGRALSNVLRNGVEAMGGEGELRIVTRLEHLDEPAMSFDDVVPVGDYALISVHDTGAGISREHMPHIFEPFYSRKVTGRNTGSGLGLSIVHGVVKNHDAYIDVSSTPGKGSCFSMRFPLVSPGSSGSQADVVGPMRGAGESILVVDDDVTQRLLGERALKRLGYRVTVAGSGAEAISLLREYDDRAGTCPFELIMLDMIMEDMDGLGTMRDILSVFPEARFVIVSGFATADRIHMAEQLGAGWLSKPYGVPELAAAVHAALGKAEEQCVAAPESLR